jgi:hypothetical protein
MIEEFTEEEIERRFNVALKKCLGVPLTEEEHALVAEIVAGWEE